MNLSIQNTFKCRYLIQIIRRIISFIILFYFYSIDVSCTATSAGPKARMDGDGLHFEEVVCESEEKAQPFYNVFAWTNSLGKKVGRETRERY